MQAVLKHHWKAHNAALYALAAGRDNQSLFSAGADRVVAEWSLGQEEPNPFAVRVDSTIYSLFHLHPDRLVIGAANGSMHVIHTEEKKEIRHLKLHDKGIFHLCYSDQSERLYAGSADGTVSVWNPNDWSLLWHLNLTNQKVRRIALSPSQKLVAIALGDGRCVLLDSKNHEVVHSIDAHDESCNSVAFIDEQTLITGGKDAYLKVWNIADGFKNTHAVPAHNFAIYDIVVHPEKKWIATASRDKTIKIWDVPDINQPLRLDRISHKGHINSVNGLFYNQEEDILFSCSDDRSICAWKIEA